jgi:hypothetical protein
MFCLVTCLHAEWTDRHIFVVARLDVTCVILMPVVLQAELLFASIAPERQFAVTKLTFLSSAFSLSSSPVQGLHRQRSDGCLHTDVLT